eukprot:TRINITY_DN1469_c0_g1_i1.p2 TRINITY_DN1469_c0_g1~~TRINITY_DN1469_c0_g1_i1.p2  ORF type:complete len:186 (+),score=49.63 TRINITY_DN1469_c0_g1_i1:211-768(+)
MSSNPTSHLVDHISRLQSTPLIRDKRYSRKPQNLSTQVFLANQRGVYYEQVVELFKHQTWEHNTLAQLRGRRACFNIQSKETTIGRNNDELVVDIDLSIENPQHSKRASALQAMITLKFDGCFYLANIGSVPLFLNGIPIECGQIRIMTHNCYVEIAGMGFVFEMNRELMQSIWSNVNKQLKQWT